MKIEIRVAWVFRYIGSAATVTSTTFPSAGAITYRSPRGPERAGSRKKTSSQIARRSSIPSGTQSHGEPRATQAPNKTSVQPGRMKGQPSGASRISTHRLKPVLGTAVPLRAGIRRAHPSGWEDGSRSRFNLQLRAREPPVRLEVALARRPHHLGRERRGRRIALPP